MATRRLSCYPRISDYPTCRDSRASLTTRSQKRTPDSLRRHPLYPLWGPSKSIELCITMRARSRGTCRLYVASNPVDGTRERDGICPKRKRVLNTLHNRLEFRNSRRIIWRERKDVRCDKRVPLTSDLTSVYNQTSDGCLSTRVCDRVDYTSGSL